MEITEVAVPGSIELHSRVVRLRTINSYRDIVVREMTETEIESLHLAKWSYAIAAFLSGAAIGSISVFVAWFSSLP